MEVLWEKNIGRVRICGYDPGDKYPDVSLIIKASTYDQDGQRLAGSLSRVSDDTYTQAEDKGELDDLIETMIKRSIEDLKSFLLSENMDKDWVKRLDSSPRH